VKRSVSSVAFVAGTSLLLACGGGGTSAASAPGGSISGAVVKGPVSRATVTAFGVSGGTMGAQLGSATTDGSGHFTMTVGSSGGPLVLQATGGSYADEATGATMTVQVGDVLTCALPSIDPGAATTGIQVTPLTSMAEARARGMTGGMTPGNMTSANAAVGGYFDVSDILHTPPMDPTIAGSGASPDSRNYGMSIAAMSQYAKDLGMTSSSGMVTAMMDDASDGVMDGRMGTSAISMMGMGGMGGGMMQGTAGTSGLSTAMRTFMGSAMNRSGVQQADMQALMDKLAASNGTLR
jgi:hypothetical protein